MYEFTFYTFCDRNYFENLNRYRIGREYLEALQPLIPEDWVIRRSEVWLQATRKGATIQPQGFKIHLSSSGASALEMLRRFVPVCVRFGVAFKIAGDATLHQFLNSKRYSRGGSGKFATIYPESDEQFVEIANAIHQVTTDLQGPYILSDKRYMSSKVVFYRYGGMQQIRELRLDGTCRMMICKPDGTLTPDERLPYFQLPTWVKDPLDTFPPAVRGEDTGLLHERYEVTESLSFTNTGGVYKAVDQVTGKTVVIKEARPQTVLWATPEFAIDAVTALRHEHAALEQLQGLQCVPKLVEVFDEWEHTFLVTEFFDGVSLANLRALEEFILLTKVDDREQTERFCGIWRNLCLKLLDTIDLVHARGIVLGDISPGNVLFNRDSEQIVLIDFESAQLASHDEKSLHFGTKWFNPGFRKPERRSERSLSPFDDYYGCGMLLYNLLCPIQTLFEIDPAHPTFRILDYFIKAGVPSEIRTIIGALLNGCPEQARESAQSWKVGTVLREATAA